MPGRAAALQSHGCASIPISTSGATTPRTTPGSTGDHRRACAADFGPEDLGTASSKANRHRRHASRSRRVRDLEGETRDLLDIAKNHASLRCAAVVGWVGPAARTTRPTRVARRTRARAPNCVGLRHVDPGRARRRSSSCAPSSSRRRARPSPTARPRLRPARCYPRHLAGHGTRSSPHCPDQVVRARSPGQALHREPWRHRRPGAAHLRRPWRSSSTPTSRPSSPALVTEANWKGWTPLTTSATYLDAALEAFGPGPIAVRLRLARLPASRPPTTENVYSTSSRPGPLR